MKLFDIIKNINQSGGVLPAEDVIGNFPAFVVNRVFSNTIDSVLFANEANMMKLDEYQLYLFYYFGLPKYPRRFGKFNKVPEVNTQTQNIMDLLGYNRHHAEIASKLLTKQDIKELNAYLDKGGR